MRICIVGKYPPIEGGVSAQTYWAARGLAERGHEVFVVTNAAEVEDAFRIHLEPDDLPQLTPQFPNGGRVRVFRPEHFGRRMSHIPRANPFVTKLAGLAAEVVEGYGCEILVGSYFEPYGVAASLAGGWTGTPVLLEHAGSDLDRLMRLPELAATYKRILRGAAGVITRAGLATRFLGMEVRSGALLAGPPYGMPGLFAPDAAPLRPEQIDALAYDVPRPFDPALPTIGIYGKPGQLKGTYDLITALGTVRAAGLDFNFLLLSGPAQQPEISSALTRAGLDDRTWRLPFLPHWRVPGFIRACTAVCFLERDFPIPIHGPVIAREVMSCGTCLVLSGEIHGKQANKDELIDGDTIVLVPDPKDTDVLAKRLRALIEEPAAAAEIGARGLRARTGLPAFSAFVDAWEALVSGTGHSGLGHGLGPVTDRLDAALPWARPLLAGQFDALAGDSAAGGLLAAGEPDDPELAARFCDFAARNLTGGPRDVARYEAARLRAMRDDGTRMCVQPVSGILSKQDPSTETVGGLYPYRRVPIRIERFDYDVTPLLCHTDQADVAEAAAIAPEPIVIGFARMPNLSPTELRLNEATVALLDRCTGSTPTGRLVAEVAASVAGASGKDQAAVEQSAYGVLAGMYASGVIGFADAPVPAAPLISGA